MMKKMIKTMVAVCLLSSISLASLAQQKNKEALLVTTHLKEINGTLAQRELYRSFLDDFMKDCPYISHFEVYEDSHSTNDHLVVWSYEVNNWKDITHFYNWINHSLKTGKNPGLVKALTPYKPEYNFGGKIHVEKNNRAYLADRK